MLFYEASKICTFSAYCFIEDNFTDNIFTSTNGIMAQNNFSVKVIKGKEYWDLSHIPESVLKWQFHQEIRLHRICTYLHSPILPTPEGLNISPILHGPWNIKVEFIEYKLLGKERGKNNFHDAIFILSAMSKYTWVSGAKHQPVSAKMR